MMMTRWLFVALLAVFPVVALATPTTRPAAPTKKVSQDSGELQQWQARKAKLRAQLKAKIQRHLRLQEKLAKMKSQQFKKWLSSYRKKQKQTAAKQEKVVATRAKALGKPGRTIKTGKRTSLSLAKGVQAPVVVSYDCGHGGGHHGRRGRRGRGCRHGQGGRGWRGGRGHGRGWGRGHGRGRGHGGGRGWGRGRGHGGGCGPMAAQARAMIHYLLNHHKKIHRQVHMGKHGIRSKTWSNDPKVARAIQIHVQQMKARLERGCPVRRWSPLFRKLSDAYQSVFFHIKKTPKGVAVVETSKNKGAARLIQGHALTVSRFVRKGFKEGRRCHDLRKTK